MATRATVVRNCSKVAKPQLHALLMEGWARCIARFGKGSFADALEISTVGLDKQLTGSMPDFATIMDAFDHDDTVLDDVLTEKGKRLVSIDAVCDVDDLRLLIARVMVKMQEVTHPDSPGGVAIVHTEYLEGEDLMRQLNGATSEWLAKCSDIRRPRAA
jgi:hypothetical protein